MISHWYSRVEIISLREIQARAIVKDFSVVVGERKGINMEISVPPYRTTVCLSSEGESAKEKRSRRGEN